VLVLHSTSGDSPNVVRAAQSARARQMTVIAFLGRDGGRVKGLADVALIVASEQTARIQELHLALEHVICELVEERLRA
jgi:D-sedoheptulose 7-phosphate isomerase